MPLNIKNPSGTWEESEEEYIKIGGVWKKITSKYIKVNGIWKLITGSKPKGYEIITSSKYWTCPEGVTSVDVFLVGGGYNGNNGSITSYGAYTSTHIGGHGGNGGNRYTKKGVSVVPGQTYQIVVGASNGGNSTALGYSSSSGTNASGGSGSVTIHSMSEGTLHPQRATKGADGQLPFGDTSITDRLYGAGGGGGGVYGNPEYLGGYGGTYGGGKGNNDGSGYSGANGYGAGGGGASDNAYYYNKGGTGGTGCVIIRWGY